jgi:MOSC domain-containing protein YiiM
MGESMNPPSSKLASAKLPIVVSLHIAKGRRLPMQAVDRAELEAGKGIVGDRYHGSRHRHVTVQSVEELSEAALGHERPIDPGLTRRNVTLGAGRLPRTPGHRIRIGSIELEVVRDAAPCKLLDDALGRGARLALARRAGVVCRVLTSGVLCVGDRAELALSEPRPESRSAWSETPESSETPEAAAEPWAKS